MKEKTDGESLRDARLNAGLAIQALADKAGISHAVIQALETNRYSGTFTAKVKLAGALGMPFKELFPTAYQETAGLLATADSIGKATKGKARAKKAK